MKEFIKSIEEMNQMYRLPNFAPQSIESEPGWAQRQSVFLEKFKRTLSDEVKELDIIIGLIGELGSVQVPPHFMLTELADLLGDVVVYCFSEAQKYDIPLDKVLHIIMQSNKSKLGADGNPIYNSDGKFLKGPNYWPPESLIRTILLNHYALAAEKEDGGD